MKSKENIVFLGMMGSGKSSIGLLVAKKLKLNFVDIDKEIEKNLNTTIKRIFETKGEVYFRKIEEKITLKKLKLNSSVISLGGGAFTNKNIRNEIIKNHLSFWLNWDDKTLIKRIKDSKKRPLVANANENEIIDLIKKRSTIYSKALYEVKCDNLSKNLIVNRVIELYEKIKSKNK
ncbi:shikimate kinase [Candidatus Pelagibacter sp. FZCC0015]|uniref:shikimate kinase n=1 Tax=Candidatus Pelagibacter sp. FZCC0015 TaxID=2268451 RepID=UPI0011A616E3|nr:shikimate kinase [Candidatus Pelagibacter sp. FZCC0015]